MHGACLLAGAGSHEVVNSRIARFARILPAVAACTRENLSQHIRATWQHQNALLPCQKRRGQKNKEEEPELRGCRWETKKAHPSRHYNIAEKRATPAVLVKKFSDDLLSIRMEFRNSRATPTQ